MGRRRNFFRRTQKKTFDEGRFRNPYFSDKSKFQWKVWLKPVGIFLLIATAIGFFLYSPLLRVQEYSVKGIDVIPEQEIIDATKKVLNKKKFAIIPNDHFLFIPKEKVVDILLETFRLDNVEVAVRRGGIDIGISEKISRFIWQTGETLFVVDDGGVVLHEYIPEEPKVSEETVDDLIIKEAAETTPLILVIVRDLEDNPVSVGDRVLREDIVLNILAFLAESEDTPIRVANLEIDSKKGYFLRAYSEDGYAVFMDPTVPMSEQLERLLTVIRGETVDPSLYEYIDVRFGDRVYIKDRL